MAIVKIKGFVHYSKGGSFNVETGEFEDKYQIFPFNMSDSSGSRVFVCETDMDVEIPDGFDPVSAMVDTLHAEIKRERAESQNRITEMERKIKDLLMIAYTPTPVNGDDLPF